MGNGYGFPMQTTSCTWPYVVPIGEDPAAHGHWCAFTDLYHTIPYHGANTGVRPPLMHLVLIIYYYLLDCAPLDAPPCTAVPAGGHPRVARTAPRFQSTGARYLPRRQAQETAHGCTRGQLHTLNIFKKWQ